MMNFRELRKQYFNSRADLALAMPASVTKIGHWENLQDLPNETQLSILCDLLHCDMDTLVRSFVTLMTDQQHMPPAVDWNPNRWYGPCAALISKRDEAYERASQQLMEVLGLEKSPHEIIIDQILGLE